MAVRPLTTQPPNDRLRALLAEAGCSNAGMAHRVNLCGAEHGLQLRYDKTSVARWLRGQQPRGRAPDIIAEALGRKLGRPVSVEEIGMAGGSSPGAAGALRFAPTVPEAVEHACGLWRGDAADRAAAVPGPGPSALVGPSRDWLVTDPDRLVARTCGERVGMSDVRAVRAATDALARLDHSLGGGHVRIAAVHYLDSVVAGLLTGSYREAVGRELFAAAARLTELAGYIAVDTGRPGPAQRYYVQALRLAQAAGDRAYGGYVLAAGMSHLALALGNPREAAQLARVAQEGARGRMTRRTEALFAAAEARGHAVTGDTRAFHDAASRARSRMDAAGEDGDEPAWSAHFDHAYLADELAHCHRDMGRHEEAARAAREAVGGHGETRVRRRAIGLLLLAHAQAGRGEVEHACRTGTQAVELLGGLRSGRVDSYLEDLRRKLEPLRAEPAVREFAARAGGGTTLHRESGTFAPYAR